MITLNQIAYNIQNLMYPNTLTLEGEVPIKQIKHWIHYHRAKLIEENVSKGALNFTNIYQDLWHTGGYADTWNQKNYSYRESSNNLDPFGRASNDTRYQKDLWNYGRISLKVPEILMLPNNSAIKEVGVKRVIVDTDGQKIGDHSPLIMLSQKTNSEKEFGRFNKFTGNEKSFYYLERMPGTTGTVADLAADNIDYTYGTLLEHADPLTHGVFNDYTHRQNFTENNNGGLYVHLEGLKISPNNKGDRGSTAHSELTKWWYEPRYTAILQDPTQINSQEVHTNRFRSGGFENSKKFYDDSSPYPIPAQYVSDLIQRVVSIEGNVVLKTMKDES